MKSVHYFYRHPYKLYFSIEKLFSGIAEEINKESKEYIIREFTLPFMNGAVNIWKNIRFVKSHQGVINHITGDAHYAILGCTKKSFNVLTIHDCVLLTQLSKLNPRYWLIKWLWYSFPVFKADIITVISENTKTELVYYTGCNPEKVRVIGNYLDSTYKPYPFIFQKQKPRILFIGTALNKNLDRLILAIEGMPVFLDLVGDLSEEQRHQLECQQTEFSQSAELSQTEMMEKYINCDLLAFPSVYEGFGLPIIEAQAIGRPVVTSNISPMNDVAGLGACFVDPYDVESIRGGLKQVIDNDEYRNSLLALGTTNVQRYELEKVANDYLEIYNQPQCKSRA